MENSIEVPQKLKIKLPHDPAIPLLHIYLKKEKTPIQKNDIHPYVHCNTIYNNQDVKATKVSINTWMDKEDMVHMYINNGLLLSHRKEWNLAIEKNVTKWMGLEVIMPSEINQRKTNILWCCLYVECKKQDKWTNNRNRLMNTQNWWLQEEKGIAGNRWSRLSSTNVQLQNK